MVIQIKSKVYRKIKEYCKNMGENEIGGLLTGKIKKYGDIIIIDAIMLKQNVGIGSFEIDDDAIMDLTKNADSDYLESIIGWWHSHGNGAAFWSMVDDSCFTRLCELSNRCFGIVASNKIKSKKIDMICRYDTYDKDGNYISIDNIKPEFDWVENFIVKSENIMKNIKKKVKKNEPVNVDYSKGYDNYGGPGFKEYLYGN